MTEIDISKIKPGDYVTVRAKCLNKTECSLELNAHNSYLGNFLVPLSSVVGHEPAPEPLKIGDVVTVEGGTTSYTITGLHNDAAWLSFAHTYKSAPVSKLRRVEQP